MTDLGFSHKQLRSIAGATATAPRINLWHGAIRSGKTVGSLLAFLMAVADAPDNGEIVVIGRTRDTVYRNLFRPLMDPGMYGEYTQYVRYNPGAPTGTIFGRQVSVIGSSDVRAEMTIRGMTVCLAYVDEATLCSAEFFQQLTGRMTVEGARLFATTNPDTPEHWLKKGFIDKAERDGHRIFHFNLEDNRKNLPEGTIESLRRQYDGLWARRFLYGEWTMADGVIYESWNPDRHVVAHADLPPIERTVALGVDYGTTNPTAGLLLGITTDRRLVVVDEWHPTRGTDGQLTADLAGWMLTGAHQPERLFVDPAAASFKLQLHADGLGPVFNGANRVTDGIRLVASLLAAGLLIVSDRCTELIREVPGYVWDAKATANGLDAPIKRDDHFCDALRYAVASSRPMWQPYLPDLRETVLQQTETLEVVAA